MEFLEEGQVLRVKSVRLRDQGLYQCLASNNAGTQMRQFRLTVQGVTLDVGCGGGVGWGCGSVWYITFHSLKQERDATTPTSTDTNKLFGSDLTTASGTV